MHMISYLIGGISGGVAFCRKVIAWSCGLDTFNITHGGEVLGWLTIASLAVTLFDCGKCLPYIFIM